MQKIKFDTLDFGDIKEKAIIFIHGWRGNKDSFKSLASIIKINNCRWYFPEAPYDYNDNPKQKTWTYQHSDGKWEVEEPKSYLKDFIDNAVLKDFNAKDVYILGFSQGATVCYEFILSLKYHFGGIFPIAGFIRDKDKAIDIHSSQFNTPIIIGHGRDDDVVPLKASEIAYSILKKKCKNVVLHVYNGKHKIGLDYLKKIKSYINNNDLSYFC